jgi:predicted permease
MTLWQDLRDAARQLRRSPGFTAAALLSLALGIGANTAIFTLLDQVLLRPLPIAHPEQVVLVTWNGPKPGTRLYGDTMSHPAYRDIRDRNTVFDGVLGRYPVALSVGSGASGHTALVSGELVSGNYFDVLGIQPAIGRLFTADDDRVAGGHPLAVLSYDYWVAQFNADPAVIGRPLVVAGVPLTIIGVSPRGFDGVEVGAAPKIRVPMAMKAQMTQGWFSDVLTLENRRVYWVQTFARLKPGITMPQAEAALQPLAHAIVESEVSEPAIAQAPPDAKARFLKSSLRVQRNAEARSELREIYDLPLRVLMAMVGFVVLIACANVANLLLERAMGRRREIAVRQALGASGWQIVRRMLTESLMLALIGGAAGLLLAMWTSQALVAFVPTEGDPVNLRTTPDLRILLFTLALCVTTGLLFGLAPALASRRIELTASLRPSARGVAGGHGRLRRVLVIAQVSLSVLLLIGASQFLRTLVNLRHVDLGWRTAQITTFAVNPSLNGYGRTRSRQFYRELMDRIRATPGVESAGAAAIGALEGDGWTSDITVEGGVTTGGDRRHATMNLVSAGYRETIGIPLIAGRDFSPSDATLTHLVAVVNETFAREYFGSQNAIGKRLGMGYGPGTSLNVEIVGVMKDSRYGAVREPRILPRIFLDNDQNDDIQQINVIVRSTLDADQMHAAMRRVVQQLDANVPVFNARTLDAQAERTLARERMVASLASAFGLLATLVAAVGVYALMAFSVTGRTREIGVRLALGAPTSHVRWLVMREVLALVLIGTCLALPVAWWLSRAVQSQLYGVTPQDAASTIAAASVLALVAVLAGFLPARRATRIDPTEALRAE